MENEDDDLGADTTETGLLGSDTAASAAKVSWEHGLCGGGRGLKLGGAVSRFSDAESRVEAEPSPSPGELGPVFRTRRVPELELAEHGEMSQLL